MNLLSDGEDAADARHETPPREPEWPTYKTLYARIRADLSRAMTASRASSRALAAFDEYSHDLIQLETTRNMDAMRSVTPTPGLVYADPVGRFECRPAGQAWRDDGAKHLDVLELRVLAAHLATALDNVNAELTMRRES